jgi:hypothetical protein
MYVIVDFTHIKNKTDFFSNSVKVFFCWTPCSLVEIFLRFGGTLAYVYRNIWPHARMRGVVVGTAGTRNITSPFSCVTASEKRIALYSILLHDLVSTHFAPHRKYGGSLHDCDHIELVWTGLLLPARSQYRNLKTAHVTCQVYSDDESGKGQGVQGFMYRAHCCPVRWYGIFVNCNWVDTRWQ